MQTLAPPPTQRRVYCVDCTHHRQVLDRHHCLHPLRQNLQRDYVTGRRVVCNEPARCIDFNRDGLCKEFSQ